MKQNIKFIVPILLFLSGCTLMPIYHRPSSPVPSQFPGEGIYPSAVKTADIGWQDFFKDPRLKKLIELALENNRDYRVALLNVQELQAQWRIVRFGLLPTFGAGASGLREHEFIANNNYGKFTEYQANVNTSYEVDLFGQIRSLQKQALEQYFSSAEASRAAEITLVAQVAQQYLTELAFEEQLKLAKQTLGLIESYADLIQKSYQLGNSSDLDWQLAQTQVETIKVSVASDERQLAQAQDALMLLVGQPLPNDLPAPQELADESMIEDLPVGLSSDLLEQRPDILQAEHTLKAANANIGVIRANFFPTITLTAQNGVASAKLAQLFTSGSAVWSFSPQVNIPLFNQNTNFASLNVAWVQQKIAIAQYEKTIQTAFQEVSDGIVARDTFNAQINAQRGLVDAEKKRFDLTSARYKNGIDSYLDVLLAQQDLFTAQSNLIQVSLDRFSNLISLYKSLGGGWSAQTAHS